MISALDAASYIESRLQGRETDGMRLQKLLYYSQAWSLAWTGRPLFHAEFQAWRDGPVNREVYDAFARRRIAPVDPWLPPDEMLILNAVLDFYGHMTGGQLSDLTHEERPWKATRGDLPSWMGSQRPIREDMIREYYAELSMSDAPKPSRARPSLVASSDTVMDRADRVSTRWREALDVLAHM